MSTSESTQDTVVAAPTASQEGHYWERRRAGALPWVLGAVGLLGLGLAHDIPIRRSMENTLESNSRTALEAAGASGVNIAFTGRDGVLTGTVPAGLTAAELVARLEGLDGVRVVRVDLGGSAQAGGEGAGAQASSSAAATPTAEAGPSPEASSGAAGEPSISVAATSGQLPTVTLAATGGTVTLTGSVPSQADIDALVAAATAQYGQGKVVNRLSVDDTLRATGLTEFAGVIGALGTDDAATVALSQGRIALGGTVSTAAVKTAVESASTAVTGDAAKVTSQLTVAAGVGSGSAGSGDKGEVQQDLVELPTITFYTGRSSLTAQGLSAVRRAAQILKDNPSVKVRIQGHTDDVGDAAANQRLSTARARVVRETLHSFGIDHDRMSFIGYGETRPAVPNTSDANRMTNRRVEFLVL